MNHQALIIVAFVCFLYAAVVGRNFVAAGLAFLTATLLF